MANNGPPSSERTRPFYPNDNAMPMDSVDWKSRYNELQNTRDWDQKRDFVGIKRLGDSYHPLEPFFKFDGVPKHMMTFDRIFWPSFGLVAGLGTGAYANWVTNRPLFSAILPTLLVGAIGYAVGEYAWHSSRRRARERDAVLIHYMLLHEQDFPRIKRERFGDTVKPWVPFRVGTDGIYVEK